MLAVVKQIVGWFGGHGHMEILPNVMVAARKYAAERCSNYIGTEHLFVGLFSSPTGPAARALANCGATESAIRSEIERVFGPPEPNEKDSDCAVAPRVNKALERAQKEANTRGHPVVTHEHLLLGLIADNESVATNLLLCLDVDLKQLSESLAEEAGWS